MADDNDQNDDADDQNDDADDKQAGDDKLREAGTKALTDERAARKRAEREAKEAKAELDKIRNAGQSEQEKAIAKAKAEGTTEALKTANARILRAEIKAAAGGKLTDPADAVRLLDLSDFEVDADGEVDSKAIAKAIDQLVKDKPYLAGNGAGNTTRGSADQGARGGGGSKPDMNAWLRGEKTSI